MKCANEKAEASLEEGARDRRKGSKVCDLGGRTSEASDIEEGDGI